MKIASIILTIGYCKLNWNFKLKCTQTDSYVYCAPFIKMKINLIFPPRRRAGLPTYHASRPLALEERSSGCADVL